jgi:hypothetical protein
MKISLLTTVAVLGFASAPALAAPFTYAPETCEFEISFPEKPYIEQKCTTGDKKICTEVVTYTRVISAETSVNIRITCKAENEKELAKYTPELMEATIKQMTSQAKMDVETISSQEVQGYKSATAVNLGERGGREIMYTAQLWSGKTSLFTLEADMTGPQDPQADQIFTDVLKSMKPKSLNATASEDASKPTP